LGSDETENKLGSQQPIYTITWFCKPSTWKK